MTAASLNPMRRLTSRTLPPSASASFRRRMTPPRIRRFQVLIAAAAFTLGLALAVAGVALAHQQPRQQLSIDRMDP